MKMSKETSAMYELASAINCLAGKTTLREDGINNGLSGAGNNASNISGYLKGVNSSLSSGWETFADFCWKISKAFDENLSQIGSCIATFCENSIANENSAELIVNQTNEKAAEILSKLGL